MYYALGDENGTGAWIRIASPESRGRDGRPVVRWWREVIAAFRSDLRRSSRVRTRGSGTADYDRDLQRAFAFCVRVAAHLDMMGPGRSPSTLKAFLDDLEDLFAHHLHQRGTDWGVEVERMIERFDEDSVLSRMRRDAA